MKWALLVVSVATLVFLVAAALRDNVFSEWRTIRGEYAQILEQKATDDRGRELADQFEVRIMQNVVPDLGATDRCITCHVGVDDPRMTDQNQPFKTHPGTYLEIHPPDQFGCTVCHQGQGLATETHEAHGLGPFWAYPLVEKKYIYSSCAKCHAESDLYGDGGLLAKAQQATVSSVDLIQRGKRLVEQKGCLGCHVLRGRGGTLGPDITFVGDKTRHEFDFSHFGRNEPREVEYWLKKHFLEPGEISPGTMMPDLGLTEAEAEALTAYVLSLKRSEVPSGFRPPTSLKETAPPTGKELYELYCSSCHGESGEVSEVPGIRTPALNNPDSLAAASDDYYRFITAFGRSGTEMPSWGGDEPGDLTRDEIDRIVKHIRSWEADPPDIANVSSRTGNPMNGRAYYQGLCANCHGRSGEGGIGNSLNSLTFLGTVSDRFLADTIIHGRPATAMASWKHLPARAVNDILAYIRTWQPSIPTFEEVQTSIRSQSSTQNQYGGRQLYLGNCASCHGREGEGGIGLRLNTFDLLRVVDDHFLYRAITEGRPTTAMPAWHYFSADQLASLISYIRSWQSGQAFDLESPPPTGDYTLGEVHYKVACAKCHGDQAEGGSGPQLSNPILLSSASDAELFHWIGRGRTGTAMRGFLTEEHGLISLTPGQIADVIAYLRYLGTREEQPILRTGVGNPFLGGQLYQANCGSCHGLDGEGSSGPQLNNPTFLRSASDGFLIATIVLGRTGTPMRSMVHGQEGLAQIDPRQVQDIVAYMRQWEFPARWRKPRSVAEMSERAITSGGQKYEKFCAGCHGPNGLGVKDGPDYFAPALNNPEFLEAASDGFLLATIARGRSRTPMRPFGVGTGGIASLKSEDITDIVSFIRAWQEVGRPKGGKPL